MNNNYELDISEEDVINVYVKQWVLEWCKKYHPEAFEEARKFIEKELRKNEK